MSRSRTILPALVALAIRFVVGGLLVVAGLAKLRAHDWWRDLVERMDILPELLTGPLAGMLPGIEVVAGLALVLGLLERGAVLLGVLLHALFGGVMLALILRDAPSWCGCFGPGSEYPVDWWHLLANVLQMLALLVLPLLDVRRLSLDALLGGRASPRPHE